jgi:hypothetical protein
MSGRTYRFAALCALLASAAAWAGVDIEIRNGDKVTGTLFPATEVEIVRFRVPKDAVLTVKAAAGRKGPQVHVDLKGPDGDVVASAEGKSASIVKKTAPASGLYSVEVSSKDHVTAGDYSLSISWKSKTSYGGKLALAEGSLNIPFSADAGATATFSAKKVKNSAAVPSLALLTYVPESSTDDDFSGASGKRVVNRTGDFVLNVTSPADGDVLATVKVRTPKASNRKYALTAKAIGGGDAEGDTAFSAIVGPTGDVITFPFIEPGQPGSQLNGTAVTVPAGALPVGTSIVISTAPDLVPPGTQTGAGATVAFGPDGLVFGTKASPNPATITIPIDPAFAGAEESITIFTRNAKGAVSPILPKSSYVFDFVKNTVSFPASHFSSFRAVSSTGAPGGGNFVTLAQISAPLDVCNAFDPSPESAGTTLYYVAEGQAGTISAIRTGTTGFSRVTWVGGGAQSTLPAGRLQFEIPDTVNSVTAQTDGTIFFATRRQIFRVDPTTGTVTLLAGTGAVGDTGDGGSAADATFTNIRNVVAQGDGLIYVADEGAHRIRVIDSSDVAIAAWAGNGSIGVGADGGNIATTAFIGPSDMSFAPNGGLYVADGGRVRWIDPFGDPSPINVTVAGQSDGDTGSGGDGGAPTSATFEVISGIAQYIDPQNPTHDALAIVDVSDHTIRIVDLTGGVVSLIAGAHGTAGFNGDSGSAPGLLNTPLSVAALPGILFIADSGNSRVRLLFTVQ